MKIVLPIMVVLISFAIDGCKQTREYEVFALKFKQWGKAPAGESVIGAKPGDSIEVCNMFWLLKNRNGKNILVDAGFIDSSGSSNLYMRPDSILKKLNISSHDISDIILTHPHYDHIDGISLFPDAQIWMQKEDYDYFTGPAWMDNGDSTGFTREDVQKIRKVSASGKLRLIDGDNIEIMPGIIVFTGSRHTFQNQYILVNANSKTNRIVLASDAIWFYLNLDNKLAAGICMDKAAYVQAIRRMDTLVTNHELIIPGHDDKVFSKFPKVHDWIVRIEE